MALKLPRTRDEWQRLAARWLPDVALALILLLLGVDWRLQGLQTQPLIFDNVDPYLRAHAWVADLAAAGESGQGLAELLWPATAPWLRHFGPALVWLYAPFVAGAASLQAAMGRRFVVQALLAPLLYLALRRTLSQQEGGGSTLTERWPATLGALAAALALGFSGEPFGGLSFGEEMYLAPDLAVLLTIAATAVLVAGRLRWMLLAFAVLPVAAMVHPVSIALAPGLLFLAWQVWKQGGKRLVLAAFGAGALFAIPELIHLGTILREFKNLTWVTATAEQAGLFQGSWLQPFAVSARAWVVQQPAPIGLLLILAVAAVPRWYRRPLRGWLKATGDEAAAQSDEPDAACWPLLRMTAFTGINLLGLLALGGLLGMLRAYHWKLVHPLLAVQLGLAVYLAARWFRGRFHDRRRRFRVGLPLLVFGLPAFLLLARASDQVDRDTLFQGDLRVHRWLAETVQQDAGEGRRWLETVVLGWKDHPLSWVFAPAVVLEQRMSGVPPERFHLDGRLYLALNGQAKRTRAVRAAMGWDDAALQRWSGVGADAPQRGPALASAVMAGVHLVARYPVAPGFEILLIRLDDRATSLAWSAWLVRQLPEEQIFLANEANHYLPYCMGAAFELHAGARYFDPAIR